MAPHPDLLNTPWLAEPGLQSICAALASENHKSRIVGGAVRDTLLGVMPDVAETVTDIDLATDAKPNQVMAILAKAGFRVLPTGIAHGTVTALTDTNSYEITTLRTDVETDGRHARVAFTQDWSADAQRRDFTINALYSDPDGTLFDPVGGLDDLKAKRLRFIGHAAARIEEDYLRILRLFRFSARLPEFSIPETDLIACTRGRHGLRQLSRERIRAEVLKMLTARGAPQAVDGLIARGLWAEVFAVVPSPALLKRFCHGLNSTSVSRRAKAPPIDPVPALAALCVGSQENVRTLQQALKLTNAETARLSLLAAQRHDLRRFTWTAETAVPLRYHHDHDDFAAMVRLAHAISNDATDDDIAVLLNWSAHWQKPVFPLTGRDALNAGIAAGPSLGHVLSELETTWLESGFTLSKTELCTRLKDIAAGLAR